MDDGYPSDWDSRRKRLFKKDNYRCQNCGRRGDSKGNADLHAHHVVPKSKGGTHELDNLTTLCSECHNAVHSDSMAPTADSVNKPNLDPDPDYYELNQPVSEVIAGYLIWWVIGAVATAVLVNPEDLGVALIFYTFVLLFLWGAWVTDPVYE